MKLDAISILSFINSADKTFVIPVYQRNYSWSAEECGKLFEDLFDFMKTGKRHYFGNIVFYAKETNAWAGYSLGYYLVKKYLKKTGKKIEDAFADKYADFRAIVL